MTTKPLLTFLGGFLVALAIPVAAQTVRTTFPDVRLNTYFSDAVGRMVNVGVIQGYDDGRFGPDDSVTRAQVAVMLDRYDQIVVDPLRRQIAALNKEVGMPMCGNHFVGETYKSDDGCNTCSCTENGEACTKMACLPRKCLSSESCPSNQYCTTEDGACESACEPGAEACIQACAGVCQVRPSTSSASAQCEPYRCKDGTVIDACSADGHVINYFADPCMTHGGYASSASSNR